MFFKKASNIENLLNNQFIKDYYSNLLIIYSFSRACL